MTRLITGRFDDAEEMKRALEGLKDAGFERSEYGTFYVAPPGQHQIQEEVGGDASRDAGTEDSAKGAAKGAALGGAAGLAIGAATAVVVPIAGAAIALAGTGVGAYIGSLMGAMTQTRDPELSESTREHPVEPQGGVRIAVNIERPGTKAQALDILRRAGAEELAEAEGEWRDRQWKDFDPRVPPETAR